MPIAVGTQVAKDGNGTTIVGGLRAFDLSAAGDGTGPWALGRVTIDGKAGVNRLGIFAEDAAAADGDTGIQVLTRRTDTAAASAGTDGDYQPFITDANGRLHVNVGNTITATIAAGAAAIGKAEDVASADGDVGVPAMAIRKASPANTSGTDGDWEALQMSAGRLWVDGSGVTLTVGGSVAHDGADSGNPLKIGGRARSSEIAVVANDDRSDLVTTLTGKLIVQPHTNPENIIENALGVDITDTTSTQLLAAQGVGVRCYVTDLQIGNAGTIGTWVKILSGSTLKRTVWAGPGGGGMVPIGVPIRGGANEAINIQCEASGALQVRASGGGYKGV